MPRVHSALLLLVCALAAALAPSAHAQSKPLILEHADSLSVSKNRGRIELFRNVRFVHDSLRFTTGHASWDRASDRVWCDGGFHFEHPDGTIEAKSGSYWRREELATAEGDVHSRDAKGEFELLGERLFYRRKEHRLELPAKPEIRRYTKHKNGRIDTLSIRARHILWNDSTEIAIATDSVILIRDSLQVTAHHAIYDRKSGELRLQGKPICSMGGNTLRGDSMFVRLDGERLKSVLVIRNGVGVQVESPGKGKPEQHSEVKGDTLYAEFSGDKMERMYASVTVLAKASSTPTEISSSAALSSSSTTTPSSSSQARQVARPMTETGKTDVIPMENVIGTFFEADLPEKVNRLEGKRLVLEFDNGKMRLATINGNARSTYWQVDSLRRAQGLNEAAGDSMRITFTDNKVDKLRIIGNLASGVYQELKKSARSSGGAINNPQDSSGVTRKTDTPSTPTTERTNKTSPSTQTGGAHKKKSLRFGGK